VALALPGHAGWIIDTPGIRSFGLAHVSADSLLHGFPDLVEASVNCPPGCDHTGGDGQCGLDALVAAGGADPRRLASFRRLLASQSGAADPGSEPDSDQGADEAQWGGPEHDPSTGP
jgi:ribosome biogenesis GTPase